MSEKSTPKILALLACAWAILLLLGAVFGGARDGLESVIPNFLASIFLTARLIVPIMAGVWTGYATAKASGKTWLGWAAGLSTAVAVAIFFLQIQHSLPRPLRRHIDELA